MYLLWTIGLGATNRIIYMASNNETASVLNAAIYQIFLTAWAGYNIWTGINDTAIDNSMIGYYLYDTISLLIQHSRYEYILHHVIALYLIYLHNTYYLAPFFYRNIMYFLMELSACMLNWLELLNNYKVITYYIYGTTRCIIYPYYISEYLTNYYEPVWYHNVHVFLLLVIYVMSNLYMFVSIKNLK
jgi:hypothetical protein